MCMCMGMGMARANERTNDEGRERKRGNIITVIFVWVQSLVCVHGEIWFFFVSTKPRMQFRCWADVDKNLHWTIWIIDRNHLKCLKRFRDSFWKRRRSWSDTKKTTWFVFQRLLWHETNSGDLCAFCCLTMHTVHTAHSAQHCTYTMSSTYT